MKKLMMLMTGMLFFLVGCSGCDAKLKITDSDTILESQEQDRSWLTWETCGQMLGDNPCDFSMTDQHGDEFSLYDHYGKVIVIDFSAMWCGVCNTMANDAQVFMDDYGSQDFIWVTVLVDDNQGNPPTSSDLDSWCSIYGIDDAYVLAGDRSIIDPAAEAGYPIQAWPTFVVIDRKMVLQHGLRGWSDAAVRQYVESLL